MPIFAVSFRMKWRGRNIEVPRECVECWKAETGKEIGFDSQAAVIPDNYFGYPTRSFEWEHILAVND